MNNRTLTHMLAMVLGAIAGFGGAALAEAVSGEYHIDCEAGEVYVVDTERCVSGFDHEAHAGHEPDEDEHEGAHPDTMDGNELLTLAESTIKQHGMSCNGGVPATVNLNDLSRTCLMQLDIACNPSSFPGYEALPGFPPIRCPWPPTDPDAESPANSIPPFPSGTQFLDPS